MAQRLDLAVVVPDLLINGGDGVEDGKES